ncbi:MAG: protein kinase [Candidatus Eiseniibacteriota bacterium]|nr:MAG: protein kinase [Candidatus Eisenbacteria bacterium]
MIGKTISRYRILSKLGEGGMGVVYKAEDTRLKRTVALKFLPPGLTRDLDARKRFIHEAQAASALDHPNICTVHEIDSTEDERMFMVMACYEGEGLKDRIKRGPLPLKEALEVAAQIAGGLSKAHGKGIFHRDIKPGNIILTSDGIAKILDFGLAKLEGRTVITREGTTLGTAAYMSPEQARGEGVDHRSDIWSLGVVLYEMLAGRPPFRSEYQQALVYSILNETPPPLTSLRPEVSWSLEQIILRATAKDPQERYHSAEEMLRDLRKVAEQLEPALRREETGTRQDALGVSEQHTLPAFLVSGPPEETPDREEPVFVARERELEKLGKMLERMLSGCGSVAFVTGEVGSGKTALIAEFARRAQEASTDVVFANGNCNAQTGIGDPYLPFREVMGLLTGDVEAKYASASMSRERATRLWNLLPFSAQALLDSCPDLIDTFVSGAGLLSRASSFSSGSAAWLPRLKRLVERKACVPADSTLQQSNLFEQYTEILQVLARRCPLILVLDDLQWADAGSTSLLFHIGRRIDGNRILLLGAYRPAEVTRAPDGVRQQLSSVVNELRRSFGDFEVSLGQSEDRHFIEVYLDTQPNSLDVAFRDTLFRHTQGHPLFTIELLRRMQEENMLVKDDAGRWMEGSDLDWEALPARVDAVIGERLGRLSEKLREILTLASVEGEEFAAEVLAAVQKTDVGELVHLLSSDLDRRYHLVSARGLKMVGTQRMSLYHFRHTLFQKYLYGNLDEVERSHLHEQVGSALESLYGQQSEEIAVHLARHFQEAGVIRKAVDYLAIAGQRAAKVSANLEAINHFNKALELLQTLPDTNARVEQELTLQLALAVSLQAAKGFAAPELGRAMFRARQLCQQLGSAPRSAQALAQLTTYYATLPEYRTALELGAQFNRMAEESGDALLAAFANYIHVWPLMNVGEFLKARECAERMVEFYDAEKHSHWAYLYGYDFGVLGLAFGSWIHWFLGYPELALRWGDEAIAAAKKLGHPFTLTFAVAIGYELHWFLRDFETLGECTDELISLSTEKGFTYWQGHGIFYRGESRMLGGNVEGGMAEMRQGLAVMRATGTETCLTRLLARMADACRRVGQINLGLDAVAEALDVMERFDERYMEAELHRLKGELLLLRGQVVGGDDEVEELLLRALEVSRKQAARSWELRATMSLSRIWQKQGKNEEARRLLAEIYGWFKEGFDTTDLKEARALLDELGSS